MEHKNKCDKYEGLFVFQTEEVLKEHIEHCPDCKAENDKYEKVSELVKEAAPVYLLKEKNKKIKAIKRLACCFIFFTGLTAFTGYKMYDNYNFQISSDYDSYITSMGLPVDDYGFLDL